MDFNVSLEGSFKVILYLKKYCFLSFKDINACGLYLITVIYSTQRLLMAIMR